VKDTDGRADAAPSPGTPPTPHRSPTRQPTRPRDGTDGPGALIAHQLLKDRDRLTNRLPAHLAQGTFRQPERRRTLMHDVEGSSRTRGVRCSRLAMSWSFVP